MGNACKFTKIRFVLSHPYLAAAAAAGANMRNAAGQPKDTILERRREELSIFIGPVLPYLVSEETPRHWGQHDYHIPPKKVPK